MLARKHRLAFRDVASFNARFCNSFEVQRVYFRILCCWCHLFSDRFDDEIIYTNIAALTPFLQLSPLPSPLLSFECYLYEG